MDIDLSTFSSSMRIDDGDAKFDASGQYVADATMQTVPAAHHEREPSNFDAGNLDGHTVSAGDDDMEPSHRPQRAQANADAAAAPPLQLQQQQQQQQLRVVRLDDFSLLKVIGKGSFGKVMLVRKLDNNKIYAMKVLAKENIIKRNQVSPLCILTTYALLNLYMVSSSHTG